MSGFLHLHITFRGVWQPRLLDMPNFVIPAGLTPVSGLRLFKAGLSTHFKNAPRMLAQDAKLLDKRQLRRLMQKELCNLKAACGR